MKNSAQIAFVIPLITWTSTTFSQTYRAVVGLNLSKMHIEDNDGNFSDEFNWKPGLNLGAMAEFPITNAFSIETGLLATTKGFKLKNEETFQGETFKQESTLNLWYLESPVNVKAFFYAGSTKIYGTLGSYLGLGLSGKAKNKATAFGETQTDEEKIGWGSKDGLRRLDYGLTAGAGMEFNAIQIGLTFGLGLANIAPRPENNNGSKIKNRNLSLSLAYKIAGD